MVMFDESFAKTNKSSTRQYSELVLNHRNSMRDWSGGRVPEHPMCGPAISNAHPISDLVMPPLANQATPFRTPFVKQIQLTYLPNPQTRQGEGSSRSPRKRTRI